VTGEAFVGAAAGIVRDSPAVAAGQPDSSPAYQENQTSQKGQPAVSESSLTTIPVKIIETPQGVWVMPLPRTNPLQIKPCCCQAAIKP
jgi:hypothetical protein